MNFTSTEKEGVVVISLTGAILGGPEAAALNNELHGLIDAGRKHAVIDLAGVSLMNSSGLGMLISSYTSLKHAGGELRLSGVNENIRTLLAIAKLQGIFRTLPTVDEAVASFV
jgi:anti-sigma B factor antagonist